MSEASRLIGELQDPRIAELDGEQRVLQEKALANGASRNDVESLSNIPLPGGNVFDTLQAGVEVATDDENQEFFGRPGNEGHWGETQNASDSETGNSRILINHQKFKDNGVDGETYRKKAITSESIHLLKEKDPERYQRLYQAAAENPDVQAWARNSYENHRGDDDRSFEDWYNTSRFDQIIGGYIQAGDKDFPTMKEWSRDMPQFNGKFKEELDSLAAEYDEFMGRKPQSASDIMRVLDGDTVKDKDDNSHRLQYIDTPEKNQVGGAEATALLQSFADDGATITPSGEQGKYGRELSTVADSEGRDYSFEALREGRALPFGDSETADAAQFLGALDVVDGRAESDPELAAHFDRAVANEAYTRDKTYGGNGTFNRALVRGSNNMEASLHGFAKTIGDISGVDAIQKFGEEGMERNLREAMLHPAELSSIDDVESLDDAWTFVVETFGEQIPQLVGDAGAAILGAGPGGVAARRGAMKLMMKKLGPRFSQGLRAAKEGDMLPNYQMYAAHKIGKAAPENVVRDATRRGMKIGARTGAASAIYAQTTGETTLGLHQEGITAPGTSLGVGAVKAALEYAPYEFLIGNLAKMTGLTANALGQVAARITGQTGIEAGTEGAQTVLDFMARNHHQGKDLMNMSDEDIDELKTAIAKGGVLGGGLTLPGAIPPAYRAARAKFQNMEAPKEQGQDGQDFQEGFVGPIKPEDGGPEGQTFDDDIVTSAEGPKQLAAQIEAFKRGSKQGVFASSADEGGLEALEAAAEETGGKVLRYPNGALLTTPDFDEEAYSAADAATKDRMRADVLGYTQSKTEITNPELAKVVSTRNEDGEVLKDQVVDADRVEEAKANDAVQFKGENVTTTVTDPESVIAERAKTTNKKVVTPLADIYNDDWGMQNVKDRQGNILEIPMDAKTKLKEVDQRIDIAEKLAICSLGGA